MNNNVNSSPFGMLMPGIGFRARVSAYQSTGLFSRLSKENVVMCVIQEKTIMQNQYLLKHKLL